MDVIDLKGLPEDQAKLIQEIVDYLKKKARKKRKELVEVPQQEEITFAVYNSNVIGKLTREEIYDHL